MTTANNIRPTGRLQLKLKTPNVAAIHPSDEKLLKKIKKLYRDDPEGFESDYRIHQQSGETMLEWYEQFFDQV